MISLLPQWKIEVVMSRQQFVPMSGLQNLSLKIKFEKNFEYVYQFFFQFFIIMTNSGQHIQSQS